MTIAEVNVALTCYSQAHKDFPQRVGEKATGSFSIAQTAPPQPLLDRTIAIGASTLGGLPDSSHNSISPCFCCCLFFSYREVSDLLWGIFYALGSLLKNWSVLRLLSLLRSWWEGKYPNMFLVLGCVSLVMFEP